MGLRVVERPVVWHANKKKFTDFLQCIFVAWPGEEDSQVILGESQVLQDLLRDNLNGVRSPLLLDPLDDGLRIVGILVVHGWDVVFKVHEGGYLVDAEFGGRTFNLRWHINRLKSLLF